MTYRCRLCPNTASGSPEYHPGKWACPKLGGYDPGRVARYNSAIAAKKTASDVLGSPSQTSEKPAAPGGGAAPSGGTPPAQVATREPPKGLERIELGARIAETAKRGEDQKQAEADWLLPSDSSQTFFETFRDGIKTIAHVFDDLLSAEKTKEGRIKDSLFEMNSHDIRASRGGFGQRFATKMVKGLGARTVDEGVATVDSLAFLFMFLTMFLGIFAHFWRVAEESPRLAKWREKRAADAAKGEKGLGLFRRRGDRAPIDTTGVDVTPPGREKGVAGGQVPVSS